MCMHEEAQHRALAQEAPPFMVVHIPASAPSVIEPGHIMADRTGRLAVAEGLPLWHHLHLAIAGK
jgi:hypothetical protein